MNQQQQIKAAPPPKASRHFLLLQGPSSMFSRALISALLSHNAQVTYVDFCPGDLIFRLFSGGQRLCYRGRLGNWAAWLRKQLKILNITDIACLGGDRPYHQQATLIARQVGINLHIFEHGYLRPGFLLCETHTPGGDHNFAKTWREYLDSDALHSTSPAISSSDHDASFPSSFACYAFMDISWNALNLLFCWCSFPFYQRHSLHSVPAEWFGWISKALVLPIERYRNQRVMRRLSCHNGPLFLLPLQLETDYQIRHRSTQTLTEMLKDQIAAFAKFAPHNATLAIKRHPLDNGLVNWRKLIQCCAKLNDAASRIVYISDGDLDFLLEKARLSGGAVVTVNSTVGLTAILSGCPTRVTGKAVYRLPDLIDPHDDPIFWRTPQSPDRAKASIFQKSIRKEMHIQGAFDGPGRNIGAHNLAKKMILSGKITRFN